MSMGTSICSVTWRRFNHLVEAEYKANEFENFVLYKTDDGKILVGIFHSASNRVTAYKLLSKPSTDKDKKALADLRSIAARNDKTPSNIPVGADLVSNREPKRYGCRPKGESRSWGQYDRAQKTLAHKMARATRKVRR